MMETDGDRKLSMSETSFTKSHLYKKKNYYNLSLS